MKTNDILYKITQALSLDHQNILKIYDLVSYKMTPEHLSKLLKRRYDKDFLPCSYEELGMFLDGLILLKRGSLSGKKDNEQEIELTNNLVLKKLRIALNLKESETELIFNLADVNLTKQQLSSLFRKENHKNFKVCSDELLMAFLDGLDDFLYTGDAD